MVSPGIAALENVLSLADLDAIEIEGQVRELYDMSMMHTVG